LSYVAIDEDMSAGVLVGGFEADHDLRRLLGVRAGTDGQVHVGPIGMPPVAGRTRRTCLRRNAGRCGRGLLDMRRCLRREDGRDLHEVRRAPTMWSRFTKSPVERIFSLNHWRNREKRESGLAASEDISTT